MIAKADTTHRTLLFRSSRQFGDAMVKLFLSYRRADSAQVTGRVYDKLAAFYGEESVFKDVDSIPLGADFRHVLEESIARCDVMLPIIGRNWLTATDEVGRRRLDDPFDFVRAELETALSRSVRIIPLLVEGAAMPKADQLPEILHALAYRNATTIRPDPDFHRDMQRVIDAIGLPTSPSAGLFSRADVGIGTSTRPLEGREADSQEDADPVGCLLDIGGIIAPYRSTVTAEVRFTVSNTTARQILLPFVTLEVLAARPLTRSLTTVPAGPIDTYCLHAQISSATETVQLLPQPHQLESGGIDGFLLTIDGEEGFSFQLRLVATWQFLGGQPQLVRSSSFDLEFPFHTPRGLLSLLTKSRTAPPASGAKG
jgi:hypothetical protein